MMRKLLAGALLALSLIAPSAAFGQVCPAVAALPDTERRVTYSPSAATGPFSVTFALLADSTDAGNWLEVWLNGTKLTYTTDWTFSLSSGGSVATACRPITNGQVTLTAASTGTLEIVGARRPRRLSQFAENAGVSARDLNRALTDIVAENRETWDQLKGRALLTKPGDTIGTLPSAATRAGGVLCFDGSGNPLACTALTGLGNVVGPNVSVIGHIATFANTSGTLLQDGGLIGAGDVTGPASATDSAIVLFDGTGGKTLKNGPAGTTTTVLHGNAAGAPTYGAVALATDVSGTLPVANGGTGLTSGTSGGVLGYTASGTLASSVALTANQLVIGAGAGATPIPLGTLGTTTTVLHGNAGGAPTFAAVSLTADVTGTLPFGNGGTGITTATSGGIPYFNSTTSLASSALLTANALMIGGGAGTAPSTPVGLGTSTTVLHGNAAGAPTFGAVVLTTDVSGTLPVGSGGTGITSGTSGGVPYFSGTTTVASSAALAANQIVLGGGAGTAPVTLGSLGTTTTVLHGNAGGAPTFGAVSLTADVSGTLPIANGGTGQGSAPAARSATGLNIDAVTTFGNANYVVLTTDRTVATSVNFSAQRTVTLPTVSSFNPGQQLVIVDSFGAINGANTMVIAANAADTINGVASIDITAQYSGGVFWPIGANKWGYIASAGGGGSGTVTSVGTGAGLSGGAITTTGTVSLAQSRPGGRLTLTTGVPVLAADATAQQTIYYTPYQTDLIPIYDGVASWTTFAFTELSVAMGGNAAWASGNLYDWFIARDSGTTRLCSGPAWTTATAGAGNRGTGAGTTQISLTNGIYLNTVSMTCRYGTAATFTAGALTATYVGTSYMTANGTTSMTFKPAAASGGSANVLGLYNAYNRVMTTALARDSTASWTTTNTTPEACNVAVSSGTLWRVTFVDGLGRSYIFTENKQGSLNSVAGASTRSGTVLNATTGTPAQVAINNQDASSPALITENFLPVLGLSFAQCMQFVSSNTGTYNGSPFSGLAVRLEM